MSSTKINERQQIKGGTDNSVYIIKDGVPQWVPVESLELATEREVAAATAAALADAKRYADENAVTGLGTMIQAGAGIELQGGGTKASPFVVVNTRNPEGLMDIVPGDGLVVDTTSPLYPQVSLDPAKSEAIDTTKRDLAAALVRIDELTQRVTALEGRANG